MDIQNNEENVHHESGRDADPTRLPDSALATYAMLRTLYDHDKDHIDCFVPLILCALPSYDDEPVSVSDLQHALRDRYHLVIPQESLNIVLTRCKRLDKKRRNVFYVDFDGNPTRYRLTQEGVVALGRIISESNVRRAINEMLSDAKQYISSHCNVVMSTQEIEDTISSVVQQNTESLAIFMASDRMSGTSLDDILPHLRVTTSREHERAVLSYFQYADQQRAQQFNTLKTMVAGSIIAATVHSPQFSELDRRLHSTTAVLDSNFLFRIFDFDHEELCAAAKELFQLMQACGRFRFQVFDFTVDEMTRTLRVAGERENQYVMSVRVGNMPSAIKSRGITPSAIREFTSSIESKLAQKRISIIPTPVRLNKFQPQDHDMWESLYERKRLVKREISKNVINHDIAAIERIKILRNRRARKLEDSGYLFVTSDHLLATHNAIDWDHKEDETVPECVSDRSLTALLWIKYGDLRGGMAVESIVSMHSSGLIIDEQVWDKFAALMRKLRSEGRIEIDGMSALLRSDGLEDMLGAVGEEGLSESFVEYSAADAVVAIGKEAAEKARIEAESIIAERSEEQEREKLEIYESAWSAIDFAKRQIRSDSMRLAKREANALRAGIIVLVLLVVWSAGEYIYTNYDQISKIGKIASFASIVVLSICGITVRRARNTCMWLSGRGLERFLYNRRYLKRLRESHLEDAANSLSELPVTEVKVYSKDRADDKVR